MIGSMLNADTVHMFHEELSGEEETAPVGMAAEAKETPPSSLTSVI